MVNGRNTTDHSPLTIHVSRKSYKPHKPDSVSKLSFIWPRHYWRDLAAYPGTWPVYTGTRASSPQTTLYMALQHPRFTRYDCYQPLPWAFTSHFHLFSQLASEVVIFCGTISFPHCCGKPALNRWVALRCPDFPPSRLNRRAIARVCSKYKYTVLAGLADYGLADYGLAHCGLAHCGLIDYSVLCY